MCTPRHRLERPIDGGRLAPSAVSEPLLDAMIDRCPMADIRASGALLSWWRATDGRLSELRAIGIEQPSAGMVEAWTVLGDEVAAVRAELHARAVEAAKNGGGGG